MDSNNSKQNNQKTEKVFSVSEYIDVLNTGLKIYSAKIVGEVSGVNFGPTGHVYFYLKDDKDQSILKCMIFKPKYDLYGVEIKDGVKIIAFGNPNMHKQYGFSFVAETIEYAGEGILKKEYEKLKKKLTEEGVFEEIKKRAIPKYPQHIGVITSLKGAVIADFSNNLGKFGFKVKIIDSLVEGQIAVPDLLSTIKTFRKQKIEVLVMIRGGGSLESLIAFNNEKLVREVANFPVPVIVGIGHHKDVPLVALAADVSVSTPTATANVLNESWEQAIFLLEKYEKEVINNYEDALENAHSLISQSVDTIREAGNLIVGKYKEIENNLRIAFQNFKNALLNVKLNLRNSLDKSLHRFKSLLFTANRQLESAEKVVNSNNPERQLRLGYSIATRAGKIIRRIGDIRVGQDMNLRVTDGAIISKVRDINKINKNKYGKTKIK